MRIYSIHTRPWSSAADQDAVSVKEGFCWLALFFPLFWALWYRLWLPLVGIIVVYALAAGFTEWTNIDPLVVGAVEVAVAFVFGFLGNDWRRHNLTARGYVETGVVAGRDRATAEHRYFCFVEGEGAAS